MRNLFNIITAGFVIAIISVVYMLYGFFTSFGGYRKAESTGSICVSKAFGCFIGKYESAGDYNSHECPFLTVYAERPVVRWSNSGIELDSPDYHSDYKAYNITVSLKPGNSSQTGNTKVLIDGEDAEQLYPRSHIFTSLYHQERNDCPDTIRLVIDRDMRRDTCVLYLEKQ